MSNDWEGRWARWKMGLGSGFDKHESDQEAGHYPKQEKYDVALEIFHSFFIFIFILIFIFFGGKGKGCTEY